MNTQRTLDNLQKLIDTLNESNSSVDKLSKLDEFDSCKEIIKWTHNSFKKFGVTRANLLKNEILISVNYDDIFELLKDLSSRKITGHAALAAVNGFITKYPEHKELILRIFDRNLQTRLSIKGYNKIWKDLIPTFEVTLADTYKNQKSKIDLSDKTWIAERKLDGLRCICIVDEEGNVETFSRSGKEFTSLQKIKDAVSKYKSTVFDGEICIVDKNDDEDYKAISSEYNRKNHTIENPRYKIFDILTHEEFESGTSISTYKERHKKLCNTIEENKYLSIVPYFEVENEKHLESLMKMAIDNSWEGLIIRRDVPYEGKRNKNILKYKAFYDVELKIVGCENGQMDDGLGHKYEGLARVTVLYKNNEVGVGSGWTKEERLYYKDKHNELIGKEMTVQYTEETFDSEGNPSLRFPVKKKIWEGKRDA